MFRQRPWCASRRRLRGRPPAARPSPADSRLPGTCNVDASQVSDTHDENRERGRRGNCVLLLLYRRRGQLPLLAGFRAGRRLLVRGRRPLERAATNLRELALHILRLQRELTLLAARPDAEPASQRLCRICRESESDEGPRLVLALLHAHGDREDLAVFVELVRDAAAQRALLAARFADDDVDARSRQAANPHARCGRGAGVWSWRPRSARPVRDLPRDAHPRELQARAARPRAGAGARSRSPEP